jgi:hypothetical protein
MSRPPLLENIFSIYLNIDNEVVSGGFDREVVDETTRFTFHNFTGLLEFRGMARFGDQVMHLGPAPMPVSRHVLLSEGAIDLTEEPDEASEAAQVLFVAGRNDETLVDLTEPFADEASAQFTGYGPEIDLTESFADEASSGADRNEDDDSNEQDSPDSSIDNAAAATVGRSTDEIESGAGQDKTTPGTKSPSRPRLQGGRNY